MNDPHDRPSDTSPDATEDHEYSTESHIRSLLKAFSWRVVATTTTVLVAYFWLEDVKAAAAIGSIEFFAKIPVYYMHERGWQIAPRGSIRRWLGREQ